jgi:hypothetical protein
VGRLHSRLVKRILNRGRHTEPDRVRGAKVLPMDTTNDSMKVPPDLMSENPEAANFVQNVMSEVDRFKLFSRRAPKSSPLASSQTGSDLYRVNFEVNNLKPFHLAFPHSKIPKTARKWPSFDGELMTSFPPLPPSAILARTRRPPLRIRGQFIGN